MIEELVRRNRSYRRFEQSERIAPETLASLVDLARLTPSAGNMQPLKYLAVSGESEAATVFDSLAWAGYLKDWPGPEEGERPAAYIVILGDTSISKGFGCDHGIAAQTIMLGAAEKGLGGCMLGAINRDKLRADLRIPERFEILLVLALGAPKEEVRVEGIGEDGSVKYWRDETKTHHVPKRSLEEILVSF